MPTRDYDAYVAGYTAGFTKIAELEEHPNGVYPAATVLGMGAGATSVLYAGKKVNQAVDNYNNIQAARKDLIDVKKYVRQGAEDWPDPVRLMRNEEAARELRSAYHNYDKAFEAGKQGPFASFMPGEVNNRRMNKFMAKVKPLLKRVH